jgi:hypothetical protein
MVMSLNLSRPVTLEVAMLRRISIRKIVLVLAISTLAVGGWFYHQHVVAGYQCAIAESTAKLDLASASYKRLKNAFDSTVTKFKSEIEARAKREEHKTVKGPWEENKGIFGMFIAGTEKRDWSNIDARP